MSSNLRLGGHIKATEGLGFVVATARGLCYKEIQTALGDMKDYTPMEVDDTTVFQYKKMTYDIATTVHLPFTINPCEGGAQRRAFYKKAVKAQLQMAEAMGASRVVMHPGFKKDLSEREAFNNLLKFIGDIWSEENQMQLLLETDSGSKNGSAIGSPEFISSAMVELEMPNLSMCLDTEHMYARGVDLWDKEIRKEFMAEFGSQIGLVHLNVPDKEVRLGSFLDRHNTPFEERKDLNSPPLIEALRSLPLILERRSIQVQEKDNLFVRDVLGVPLEKTRA